MFSIHTEGFDISRAIIDNPLTIAPTASVIEALQLMSAEKFSCSLLCSLTSHESPLNPASLAAMADARASCVLVIAENQLVGILTERDVVRLSGENRDLATVTMAEAMSHPVQTLQRSDLKDIFVPLNLFRQHRIRHLGILEADGSVVGIITHESIQQLLQPVDLLRMRCVSEVMVSQVISVSAEVSILQVAQLMTQHRISCIVVAEPAAEIEQPFATPSTTPQASPCLEAPPPALRPIGIVTEKDIVHYQTLQLPLERIAVQEVMSRPVFTVYPEESILVAHQRLQTYRISRIVVVNQQGHLTGLITQTSLLNLLNPSQLYQVLEVLHNRVTYLEQEKQAKVTLALKAADAGMWEWNLTDRTMTWSDENFALLGYAVNACSASYEAWLQAIHPDDRDRVIQQVQSDIATQSDLNLEYRVLWPDGTCRWLTDIGQLTYDSAGNPINVLGIRLDITERKQAESLIQSTNLTLEQQITQRTHALQQSEEKFRQLAEHINAVFWLTDLNHQLLYISPAYQRIWPKEQQPLFKSIEHCLQSVHIADHPKLRQAFEHMLEAPQALEYRSFKPDGTLRWMYARSFPIRDASGQVYRLSGLLEDITQRKLVEEALQDSEQRYASLAAAAPVGIFRTDAEGHCIYVNERWCEIAGLSAEAALGEGWIASLYLEDRSQVFAAWQQFLDSDHPFQLEYRLQRPDQQITWVYGQAVAERNSHGDVISYVGTITDISDRKRAEQALQKQIEFNRIITNFSNSFINTTFDEIPSAIQSALQVIGELGPVDLIYVMNFADSSQPVTLLYQPGPSPRGATEFPAIVPEFQNFSPLHHPLHDFPWTEAQVQVSEFVYLPCLEALPPEAAIDRHHWRRLDIKSLLVFPLSYAGDITGWVCFIDRSHEHRWSTTEVMALEQFSVAISHALQRQRSEQLLQDYNYRLEQQVAERTEALRQSQAELQTLNQELLRSNQELENFAYVASHDLREPLRAIVSHTQILQEIAQAQSLDEGMLECLHYIQDGGLRMQQLIQDLLIYARLSYRELERGSLNCQEVIEEVLRNLHVAIVDNQATIIVDPLPTLQANRTQMIQLLQNLVDNAIKFRQSSPQANPPRIHITAIPLPTQGWQFAIQDNGIGMKPQYLDRIFDIFRRLHPRTKFPGTGIGLAICKKIVELYGGKIWAESELGVGTTIYFTILN
ncbi:PAS domain-containing protein [Alkalinema sp. FACHB-956]|uniref:PAS domain-containing protein n=1 Tax=Alkalinema sp. FACHB-956 TaxID=2692768 RepID=UPI001688F316|nr:PAS domain-containing protein [Alkalinema sp. FACHB-956]MBD2327609.1 PAS domain-containing protein [Alkalinema sp. FACHB-956]